MTIKEYNTIYIRRLAALQCLLRESNMRRKRLIIQMRRGNNLPVSVGLMNVKKLFWRHLSAIKQYYYSR